MKASRTWLVGIVAAIATLAIAGLASGSTQASARNSAKAGGTIRAAIDGDPQMFDVMYNGRTLTTLVGWNIFEALFAVDAKFQPQPMLAKSYTVSKNGRVYTIALRDGVKFHNGQPFTSADAKASLERWMMIAPLGKTVASQLASLKAPNKSTIVIALKKRRYSLITDLAWYQLGAYMLPASIAKAAGAKPLTTQQHIGTGPYMLGSYQPGKMVTLVRYKGYKSLTKNQGGLAGRKAAYADKIEFNFVPDPAQRLNGLLTGTYDWVSGISVDDIGRAGANPGISLTPGPTAYVNTLMPNHAPSSVFSNLKARQALNMLLNKPEIAVATFGPSELWRPLTPSWATPSNTAMYTTAGESTFRKYDPQRAKQLFAEAGVTASRPIRIISTQTYPQMYQWAVMIQAALKSIGLNADIQVYDYPTADQFTRTKPDAWDLTMSFYGSTWMTPDQILWLTPGWPGSYHNAKIDAIKAKWQQASTAKEAHKLVDQLQSVVWADLPVIMLGAQKNMIPYSSKLKLNNPWANVLWNAEFTK